jgi:RTX calcium-binding nonapeptide repeat (4 copies)
LARRPDGGPPRRRPSHAVKPALVAHTPPWASGNCANPAAANPQDDADFLTVAARRCPPGRRWDDLGRKGGAPRLDRSSTTRFALAAPSSRKPLPGDLATSATQARWAIESTTPGRRVRRLSATPTVRKRHATAHATRGTWMTDRRVVAFGATWVAVALGAGAVTQAPGQYTLPSAKPAGCPQRGVLVEGTAGNDTRNGTGVSDVMIGLGGNDTFNGLGRADCLYGNDGNDRLIGAGGNDALYGLNGNDRATGGAGNDIVSGDAGNDTVTGGDGRDNMSGGSGRDAVSGGAGSDRLQGAAGGDRISGGSGRDTISGAAGNDRLSARDGVRDTVNCGSGRDTVRADTKDSINPNCERVARK